MEYGHILKVRPMGFVERINIRFVTKSEFKYYSQIFYLSQGMDSSFPRMEKSVDWR